MSVTQRRHRLRQPDHDPDRDFDAPIDRVWELWSDRSKLERWLGPSTHPATIDKHDLTPGGEITFFMTGPEGVSWGKWQISAVDPPSSLEFADAFTDADGTPIAEMPVSTFRVRLTERDGGTRMEMVATFESPEDMKKSVSTGTVEGLQAAVGQMDACSNSKAIKPPHNRVTREFWRRDAWVVQFDPNHDLRRSPMKRSTLLLGVALALCAIPTQASAERGWRLPKVESKQGDRVFTSRARHCGRSQYGVWRFRNALKTPQRRGYVVYRARLSRNERLHRPRLVRFGGNLSRRAKQRTRRLLRRVKFRYTAGPPRLVESIRRNGSLQASRPFNPVRKRC